jgi:hypothetical protein
VGFLGMGIKWWKDGTGGPVVPRSDGYEWGWT